MKAFKEEGRFSAAIAHRLVSLSRGAGWVVAAGSLAFLLGWCVGIEPFRVLAAMNIAPRANAALCGLFMGLTLIAYRKFTAAGVILSLLTLSIASSDLASTLLSHSVGITPVLERLAVTANGEGSPRMTELAAVGFSLLAFTSLASFCKLAVAVRHALALLVICLAMVSSASYGIVLAGDEANHVLQRLPITTATGLFLLSLGWIIASPAAGLARIVSADSQGGMLARRLLLPSLLLPVALTFVFKFARTQLHIPEAIALALTAVITGCTIAGMIAWVAVLLDNSERQRRTVRDLHIDANTDALTGLANRRTINSALEQILNAADSSKPASLLMLDIDHFKSYNDTFGHQAGDEVIRTTSQILRASVRPGDTVARYGGEEFLILLPNCDADLALAVGERIVHSFRAYPWIQRLVTISAGATSINAGDTADSVLARADKALYDSKNSGRDRITLSAERLNILPGTDLIEHDNLKSSANGTLTNSMISAENGH